MLRQGMTGYTEGPRGGIHSKRFNMVLPPRLHAEIEWVARRREVSMGQVIRDEMKKVCAEERERFMREVGA